MVTSDTERSTSLDGRAPARLDRAAALAVDLGWGALAVLAAALLAFAWLFIRTDRGAQHVTDGDSIIAAGLVGAAVPAWLAWIAVRALAEGATHGQQRMGIRVEARMQRPVPRLLRLLVHPVSVPGWLWVAGVLAIVEVPWIPVFVGLIAVTIAVMGVISALVLTVNPGADALHDRLAGTRTVRDGTLVR